MQKNEEGEIKPIISRTLLKWCFVFSKMTVLDEEEDSMRYHSIAYVEFLEMLCRVAIRVYPDNSGQGRTTPVHLKVENLLQKIYDFMWNDQEDAQKAFSDERGDQQLILVSA